MGKVSACMSRIFSCACCAQQLKEKVEDAGESTRATDDADCNLGNDAATATAPGLDVLFSQNSSSTLKDLSNSYNDGYVNNNDTPSVLKWMSGARKETLTIDWQVQNFPALCELKELLRNEACVFSLGSTIHHPTRWCFNLQKMKNETNIGLFLKRLKPLTFDEILEPSPISVNLHEGAANGNNNNGNAIQAMALQLANPRVEHLPPPGVEIPNIKEDPVYVYYECLIKRSGVGETWLHKRTCIPNFEIGQRLGFRKLFTLDDMNEAGQPQPGSSSKPLPLLSQDNTLSLEINFTVQLKTDGRTKSELDLLETFSLEKSERYHYDLLREQLISLFKTGANSDLILIMESDDRIFSVHKAILSARSPVFAAMVQSGMKESLSGIVRIKDVSSKAMETILSYVYCGVPDAELKWNDVREVEDLIYAADKYSMHGLRDFADKMMSTGCDKDNAMELLYLAQHHGLNVAVKKISMYIKRNVHEIFNEKQ